VISANSPRGAGSPYGQTKIQADAWVSFFQRTYGLDASSFIAFNHESPLRPPGFVWKIIQSQIELKTRGRVTVRLNNPESAKDWGWAPDYMEALLKTEALHSSTQLVLASGRLTPLTEIVHEFARQNRVEDYEIVESGEGRRNDAGHPVGDISETTKLLGWTPSTSIARAVSEMVEFSQVGLDKAQELERQRAWIKTIISGGWANR
jgi:GDPmannose 4,6-dehydratase